MDDKGKEQTKEECSSPKFYFLKTKKGWYFASELGAIHGPFDTIIETRFGAWRHSERVLSGKQMDEELAAYQSEEMIEFQAVAEVA